MLWEHDHDDNGNGNVAKQKMSNAMAVSWVIIRGTFLCGPLQNNVK